MEHGRAHPAARVGHRARQDLLRPLVPPICVWGREHEPAVAHEPLVSVPRAAALVSQRTLALGASCRTRVDTSRRPQPLTRRASRTSWARPTPVSPMPQRCLRPRCSRSPATCGGGGISPTYGAALWIVDYVLQSALIGVDRLYFHHGTIGNCVSPRPSEHPACLTPFPYPPSPCTADPFHL